MAPLSSFVGMGFYVFCSHMANDVSIVGWVCVCICLHMRMHAGMSERMNNVYIYIYMYTDIHTCKHVLPVLGQ